MSIRSDRKWAEKNQHLEDVRGPIGFGGPKGGVRPGKAPLRVQVAAAASEKAKASGTSADHSEAAKAHTNAAIVATRKGDNTSAQYHNSMAAKHSGAARAADGKLVAKREGERNLEQAKAHEAIAKDPSLHPALAEGHAKVAVELRTTAERQASEAGGEWDESKHPRDENGKFG